MESRWTLQDNTRAKAGYLSILCNGKRAADVFPFAKDANPIEVRAQAEYMVATLNAAESIWATDIEKYRRLGDPRISVGVPVE